MKRFWEKLNIFSWPKSYEGRQLLTFTTIDQKFLHFRALVVFFSIEIIIRLIKAVFSDHKCSIARNDPAYF